ncbi:Serine/threonine-protein kinase PknB [Gimesia chilikensis]|uniref:Serine/threonine-protein kinase PknB n=1 Tax=Gimesia chilikensis TaxID=2605989 RepID=A0A517WFA7_9PLAN|nr:serine/threonine-protein kinase [Gimesia chilikensis]QDU03924.1 Serine/threonine-protein kinase PknB [Gimesia chilikensis]
MSSKPTPHSAANTKSMPTLISKDIRKDAGKFCPHAGVVSRGSGSMFQEQGRTLLLQRLRMASLLLGLGATAFLIRGFWLGEYKNPHDSQMLLLDGVLAVILFSVSAFLWWKPCLCKYRLRICEAITFGAPAGFFIWWHFSELCACDPVLLGKVAFEFPLRTAFPWVILIFTYGIFIPNSLKGVISVVSLMVISPIVGAIMTGMQVPQVSEVLYSGGLSEMIILLLIAASTAVYGSHRVDSLRREAFDLKSVGMYTLRKQIGSGGMGEVYLAEHRLLKRPCAIKLIRRDKVDDENVLLRFESEVQATAGLTHPNTIEIYDYGHTEEGTFYYAMEFLPGLNLQEIVERFGPLPQERVVYLLRQVCSALAEAHQKGLIHRDIKPGNIFSAERGGLFDVAKLLDFGLVKYHRTDDVSLELTMEGAVVGSPLYTSPEVVTGDGSPGPRSDIYSLGASAYYLLTGKPVFEGDNALKVMFAHASQTVKPLRELNPEVSPELEEIIMKCLEKKPDDRYQNSTELLEALEQLQVNCWTQAQASAWWSEAEHMVQHVSEDDEFASDYLKATTVLPVNV